MDSLEAKVEKLKNAWHEFTMGIANSDLLKFGVDVLTNLIEIINKATDGVNGFGGAISKIISVFAIFKLGSKIFEKFKPLWEKSFFNIVARSKEEGYKAGKAFAQGVRDAEREEEAEQAPASSAPASTQPD
jgi:hypothetical protein